MANEPHCPLGHDKPLKHQLIPEVATEKGRRPAFSDGLLPEDARLTQPGPPSAPPQTGWAQQRRWLLQEKLLKPLSPSCQHMPQKFYESSPRMPRSTPPQEPPYFLPLRSTSGTVARKDHGSSQAQRQVSLPFAGCRLPSSAPPDSQPGARSSTSGVRGGDNGSGAGGARRQLTGVCGFVSWPPSRPAWALWGVGESAAAQSQSWRAEWGPVRGAAEAQHVKRRRLPVRGEPLSRAGWLRRPSSSR